MSCLYSLPFTLYHKKGFTLVEILVVLAITTIIGGMVYANFGSFREDQALSNAEADLGNFIHLAQTNSISAVKCEGVGDASWFLEVRTNRTAIDMRCSTTDEGVVTTTTKSTMQLNGATINSIDGSCGPSSFQPPPSNPVNIITINFAPLYGTTTFLDPVTACIASGDTLAITLKDTKTGSTKTVTIGKGGGLQ